MSTPHAQQFRILLALLIAGAGGFATLAICILAAHDRPIPHILVAMAGAAFGSLATAFSRFPPPPSKGE